MEQNNCIEKERAIARSLLFAVRGFSIEMKLSNKSVYWRHYPYGCGCAYAALVL